MAMGNHPAVSVASVRRRARIWFIVCSFLSLAWPGAALAQEPAELTLRDALALALQRNPELAAFGKERSATEAAILQAGVLPNPVLEIAGDNLRNARKAEAGDRTAMSSLTRKLNAPCACLPSVSKS